MVQLQLGKHPYCCVQVRAELASCLLFLACNCFNMLYSPGSSCSTEHNFTVGSPQYEFIEADLAKVDRSTTPWVIVAGHRYVCETGNCIRIAKLASHGCTPLMRLSPMYSSSAGYNIGQGRNTNNLQTHLMANIEPLLVQHKVSLALWGHVHKVRAARWLLPPAIGG